MAGGPNCFYIVVQNLNCLFLLIYFKKMCILATLKFKSQVVYLFGWFFTIWFEKSCTIIPWLFPYMPSIEKTVIILSTGHDCIWWLIAHKTINKIRLNNWHCNVKRDHGTPLSWIQPWIWQINFSAFKVICNSKRFMNSFLDVVSDRHSHNLNPILRRLLCQPYNCGLCGLSFLFRELLYKGIFLWVLSAS